MFFSATMAVFLFLLGVLFHMLLLHILSSIPKIDHASFHITDIDDKTAVLPLSISNIHTIIGMVVYIQRQARKHPVYRMWELPPARKTAEYIEICAALQDRLALMERAEQIDI